MNIGYRRNSWYWWGANTSFLWRYLLVVSIQIVCASTSYSVVYNLHILYALLKFGMFKDNEKFESSRHERQCSTILQSNAFHFRHPIINFFTTAMETTISQCLKITQKKISCDNNCDRSSASKLSIQRKEIKVWTYATFSVKDFKWISNIV